MAKPQHTRLNFPLITLSGVCFCLIAYAFPAVSDLIVYDRQLVLEGQLWRLGTGIFVHFSANHLAWDLLVFALAAWAIEASGDSRFWAVCFLSALIPGIWFAATMPEMPRYGGISGLATAAVAYLCLRRAAEANTKRLLWIFLLGLVIFKSAAETLVGTSFFVMPNNTGFRIMPLAHIIGVAVAVVVFGWEIKGGTWNRS